MKFMHGTLRMVLWAALIVSPVAAVAVCWPEDHEPTSSIQLQTTACSVRACAECQLEATTVSVLPEFPGIHGLGQGSVTAGFIPPSSAFVPLYVQMAIREPDVSHSRGSLQAVNCTFLI